MLRSRPTAALLLVASCTADDPLVCTGQSVPEAVVAGRACVGELAVDTKYLYWTEPCAGQLLRASLSDGTTTVLASVQPGPVGVVLDDDFVYFTTASATEDGTVARVSKSGGAVTVLATGQKVPFRLALHDDRVYWIQLAFQAPLMMAPKDGSAPAVGFAQNGSNASDLAVDDSGVYWVESSDFGSPSGALLHCPLEGCEGSPVLVDDQPNAFAVVLDSQRAFWALASGTIRSVDKHVPAPEDLHIGPGGINALTTLHDSLVWAEGNAILTLPKEGGVPATTVIEGKPFYALASSLCAAGSCVYYAPSAGHEILRIGLP